MPPAYHVETLIAEDALMARVDELARAIDAHFADSEHLLVVGLLRGSFIFTADLVRRLTVPCEIDFIEASSYGDGTVSAREVTILKDLRAPVDGRDVLIVEDIVDTGHTLAHVHAMLARRAPRRMATVALLSKPARREVKVELDWVGFEIPDVFVVGYGIDYAQQNRNLPFIGAIVFDGS